MGGLNSKAFTIAAALLAGLPISKTFAESRPKLIQTISDGVTLNSLCLDVPQYLKEEMEASKDDFYKSVATACGQVLIQVQTYSTEDAACDKDKDKAAICHHDTFVLHAQNLDQIFKKNFPTGAIQVERVLRPVKTNNLPAFQN